MLHPVPACELLIGVAFAALGAVFTVAQQPASAPSAAGAAPRTMLVTGANRGIGLELARQYLDAGWSVIATAREPQTAAELQALGAGKPLLVETLDVTDGKSVAALAERLKDRPIDLLINNAGVASIGNRIGDVKPDEFAHVLAVNTIGPLRVTQALLKNLRAGKGKTVVSITSVLGSIEANGGGGFYGYRESKAALNMLTRTLAAELRRDGFICIVMHPGWVQTDMGGANAELTPEQSVTGMRGVIAKLKPEDSGKFWSHDGKTLPW